MNLTNQTTIRIWSYLSHTHPFNGPFPGLPRWAGTRKVKPVWILLKQETVSGSGISWTIYKSALRSRQITTLAPHHSVFYRPDALPATQPTASKYWRTDEVIYQITQYFLNISCDIKLSYKNLGFLKCNSTALGRTPSYGTGTEAPIRVSATTTLKAEQLFLD